MGDWNLVMNPALDYENHVHVNNSRSRNAILNYINSEEHLESYARRKASVYIAET